jgi:hypothetical protein
MLCPCRRRPLQNPRKRSVHPRAGTVPRPPLDQCRDEGTRVRGLGAGQADEEIGDRLVTNAEVPPALVAFGEARATEQRDPRELGRRQPPVQPDQRVVPRGPAARVGRVPKARQHHPGVVRLVGNHPERDGPGSDRAPIPDLLDARRATDGHAPEIELRGFPAPVAGTAQPKGLIVSPRCAGQTPLAPDAPTRSARDPHHAVMDAAPETRIDPGRALRFHVAVRLGGRVDGGGHQSTGGHRRPGTRRASAPPSRSFEVGPVRRGWGARRLVTQDAYDELRRAGGLPGVRHARVTSGPLAYPRRGREGQNDPRRAPDTPGGRITAPYSPAPAPGKGIAFTRTRAFLRLGNAYMRARGQIGVTPLRAVGIAVARAPSFSGSL